MGRPRIYPPLRPKDEFKRLTLLALITTVRSVEKWLCECICGALVMAWANNLRSGRSGSCGCLRKDVSRGNQHGKRHGESGVNATPEYLAWVAMMRRCYCPSAGNWDDYGGKGIAVCERWHTYENFLADVGRKPSLEHSSDRYPNPYGNYGPSNFRWATDKEQARNRTDNHLLTIGDVTQCVAAWCEDTGLASSTLHNRIIRGDKEDRLLRPARQLTIN